MHVQYVRVHYVLHYNNHSSSDARAPVLTQQPEAYLEAVKGEPLVLTIEAEGARPMNFTWFKGAQQLKYCSGNILRVPSAGPVDGGQYCCTVSNAYGSTLSDVVVVKVVLQRSVQLPPITSYSESHPPMTSYMYMYISHVYTHADTCK